MSKSKRYHTTEQLQKLAQEIVTNQVFVTDMLPPRSAHLLGMIFMPLIFAGKDLIKNFKDDRVVHFYEYWKEAGPRSINGYPIFMSMRMLTREDYKVLRPMVRALDEAMSKAMETLPPPEPAQTKTQARYRKKK